MYHYTFHDRYWTSIKQIINTFTQLLTMSASLMALVVWFLFIYTIIGHRIFGGRYIHTLYTYICNVHIQLHVYSDSLASY